MRGVFDHEELGLAKARRDTELTLGSGTLLAIFFGLVVLCGLCFGLGYSVGHHVAAPTSSTVPQPTPPGEQEPLQASGIIPKPAASQQTAVTPQADESDQGASGPPGEGEGTGAASVAEGQNQASAAQPPQTAQSAASSSQPAVRPALRSATGSSQSASTPNVHPALGATSQFMVQVAAVSTPDDAEVLMGALRKRGYAVTVRRDLTDNLIHVRVGPFATRELADQWRQKLLNDGYNAIVQP
jgi:DedD protein